MSPMFCPHFSRRLGNYMLYHCFNYWWRNNKNNNKNHNTGFSVFLMSVWMTTGVTVHQWRKRNTQYLQKHSGKAYMAEGQRATLVSMNRSVISALCVWVCVCASVLLCFSASTAILIHVCGSDVTQAQVFQKTRREPCPLDIICLYSHSGRS